MGLFGTSGIRAIVDSWLLETALKVGLAVGSLNKRVVVGGDTRTSSAAIKQAALAGLLAGGARSYDAGVLPTPTLALVARGFDAGVMITASHNPPEYNGLKLLNRDGSAFDRRQQREIEEIVSRDSPAAASWYGFQSADVYPDAVENHLEKILEGFPGRFGLKVALDCGCGAASVIAPELLRRMGCDVLELNCYPGGFFPRGVEPTPANLIQLMKAVVDSGADLGIAHDGDADRMMLVDDRGRFVAGDKLLLIVAKELGARKIVTTVDASMVIDQAGFDVVRTMVGDNYVSQELKRGGDFGGEPSGSWIFPRNSLCPDGIYAAAVVVSIASKNRLSRLVDDIADFPLLRASIGRDGVSMSRLEEGLIMAMKPLSVDRMDGAKLGFKDGWLLVRASGTEPKIRVTVEAKAPEKARRLYYKSVKLIKEFSSDG